MLERVIKETGPRPAWSIIWLHGLGADGNDFAPIVPELVGPEWPAVRFVFPHAEVMPVTINGGARMRAWYDIVGFNFERMQEDEQGTRRSVAHVEALIAHETQQGIASRRIFLAGFSQGGAIALACGLRYAQPLAGIVALSTYLPLREKTAAELNQANRKTPLWFGHGKADPVVPHALGKLSKDTLAAQGYDVAWHEYPMPHSVCAEEIRDLSVWLGKRFSRNAD